MSNRLTKIYTRQGDSGLTGLANGERIPKSEDRIEAVGTVDETNCVLGVVLSSTGIPSGIRNSLRRIQNELFDLGAELALSGHTTITAEVVLRLEIELDELNASLPPLKEFILPGGNPAASACHLARATCRRAERRAWMITKKTEINPELLKYLNRLSDLLFVIARVLARQEGTTEVLWNSGRR